MPLTMTFSRPDISWWKPTPTLSSGATRPTVVTVPAVGAVTPASRRISVLFPAPLRPRMPTVSPAAMEKLTSLRAISSSRVGRLKGRIERSSMAWS